MMNADYQAATQLYRIGRFAELLSSSPTTPASVSMLPDIEHRLLIAETLIYADETDSGAAILAGVELAGEKALVRAKYEFVSGLLTKRRGRFQLSVRHLQSAVRAAQEAGDIALHAKCQLYLFRLLAEGYPDAKFAVVLPETRKLVMRAGEPHLMALLHDSVALMEGQTGRCEEARRHLELASSILDRYPHAWVQMSVHTGAFCVAWLECEFERAAEHLRKAKIACSIAMGRPSTPILDVNQAHLDLMTGNFPAASQTFGRLLAGSRSSSRIAALDGLARLHLALNELPQCESLVKRIAEARAECDSYMFYPLRWSTACAVRLAIRTGNAQEAIAIAEREIESARELNDVPLVVALMLLKADAQAACGTLGAAGKTLMEAAEFGATVIREHDGHFYETCGRILSNAGSGLARIFAGRAIRKWKREGNIWAQVATVHRNGETLPLQRFRQGDAAKLVDRYVTRLPRSRAADHAAQILNSAVAACDLAYDPTLAAAELRTIVNSLQCGDHLSFNSVCGPDHTDRTTSATKARLYSENRGTVEVRCRPSDDPAQNIVMSNVLSLIRTLDELARYRRSDRNRAALWPADEVENEATLSVSQETIVLRSTARKVGPTNVPVLITGETGTGKEILARAIHAASTRAEVTFLPFNCSVGPRDMIDAQLFGHRRGAFTGATEHAPGVIRAAAGGTLFLDEIGESPLDVQPKLLRFLESGEIHPIGEPQPIKVDVRVIAATNVDLDAAVSTGRFREDLFYRLNIVRLHVPPLRERRVEIPVFAQHYLRKYAREQSKGDLRLAEETMEYLLLYKWPGNVRQLANEMRRLAALAETDAVLMPEHLSSDILASRRTVPPSERSLDANEAVVRLDQPLAAATEHLERAMLQYALKACGGRMEETARRLGLSRKGLYLKRVRLGLEPPETHAQTA